MNIILYSQVKIGKRTLIDQEIVEDNFSVRKEITHKNRI